MWDTTLNQTEQSLVYAGAPLRNATSYIWRVQTASSSSTWSGWSDNATFVTGVWTQQWPASTPVWAGNASAQFVLLRHQFSYTSATSTLASAVAFVTANPQGSSRGEAENAKLLGAYRLYVEGATVGIGPGRPGRCGPVCPTQGASGPCTCAPEHVYDTFDITPLLRGDGLIMVALQAFNYPPGPPSNADSKVQLMILLTFADGSTQPQGLGPSATRALGADDFYNASCCTAQQWFNAPRENFNMSLEPQGWRTRGFDDSAWPLAAARPPFVAPLVARPTLPLAITTGVVPASVTQAGSQPLRYFIDMGREVQGGLTVEFSNGAAGQLVYARLGETLLPDPGDQLPQVMYEMSTGNSYWMGWGLRDGDQTVENHEYLEFRYAELVAPSPIFPQCVRTAAGEYDSLVTLRCAVPGASISEVAFASWGTPSGACDPSDSNPANNSFAANGTCASSGSQGVISALCVGRGNCSFTPSDALFGGTDPCRGTPKYLAAAVVCTADAAQGSTLGADAAHTSLRAAPAAAAWVPNVTAWTVVYPAAYLPDQVALGDPDLQAVWELSRYTVVATLLDMYTDSNTRQRSVICAEALLISIMMQYATSTEFAQQTYTLEYMLNQRPHSVGWAEWQALSILSVYAVYSYTGDLSMFTRHYDQLRNFTELGLISSSTGLWTCQNGELDCANPEIDWPSTSRDGFVFRPANSIVNGYTARAAALFSEMALAAGGHDADAALLAAAAASLAAQINAQLYNASAGAFVDGLGTSHSAWHSSLYLLSFGLVAPERAEGVWDLVVRRSVGDGAVCNPGNVYPAYWAFEAFYGNTSDFGVTGLAYLTCNGTKSWLGMLRQGATTTMEAWRPSDKPNLTWSHPWAASPAAALLRWFFGIRPLAPGFSSVIIQPQPGTVPWGNATLPSIRGPIRVSFTQTVVPGSPRAPSAFSLSLALPGNVNATVCLPLAACHNAVVDLDGVPVPAEVRGAYACLVGVVSGAHSAACPSEGTRFL